MEGGESISIIRTTYSLTLILSKKKNEGEYFLYLVSLMVTSLFKSRGFKIRELLCVLYVSSRIYVPWNLSYFKGGILCVMLMVKGDDRIYPY